MIDLNQASNMTYLGLQNTYILIVVLSLSIIPYIWMSIARMLMFAKIGASKWKAWIPIVDMWTFLELGGQKGALALLPLLTIILAVIAAVIGNPIFLIIGLVLPVLTVIYSLVAAYHIAKGFGKNGSLYVVLYIFISLIYMSILGFGKSRWSLTGDIPRSETSTPVQRTPEITQPLAQPVQESNPSIAPVQPQPINPNPAPSFNSVSQNDAPQASQNPEIVFQPQSTSPDNSEENNTDINNPLV